MSLRSHMQWIEVRQGSYHYVRTSKCIYYILTHIVTVLTKTCDRRRNFLLYLHILYMYYIVYTLRWTHQEHNSSYALLLMDIAYMYSIITLHPLWIWQCENCGWFDMFELDFFEGCDMSAYNSKSTIFSMYVRTYIY